MNDQNKSDEEKKKKEEEEYELRIDDACQRGVIKVPKNKNKKDNTSNWGWV